MIEVQVKDQEVLAMLQRLTRGMADMSPAMLSISNVLMKESEEQFRDQRGPRGAWEPLSPLSTVPMRAKRGYGPTPILQITGQLAASVQPTHGTHFAAIGSNKAYAAMQFFGGTTAGNSRVPGKSIPARPYMPFDPDSGELSDSARRGVLDVLADYIQQMSG